MAATALVAAALEDNEEEGEGQGDNDISSGEDGSDSEEGGEKESQVGSCQTVSLQMSVMRVTQK